MPAKERSQSVKHQQNRYNGQAPIKLVVHGPRSDSVEPLDPTLMPSSRQLDLAMALTPHGVAMAPKQILETEKLAP